MHQGDRDEVKGVYHINGIGLDLLGWVLDACATNPSHDIAAEHIRTECALNLKGDKPCAPLWRTLRPEPSHEGGDARQSSPRRSGKTVDLEKSEPDGYWAVFGKAPDKFDRAGSGFSGLMERPIFLLNDRATIGQVLEAVAKGPASVSGEALTRIGNRRHLDLLASRSRSGSLKVSLAVWRWKRSQISSLTRKTRERPVC